MPVTSVANLATEVDGILPVANGGTGTATPTTTAGAGIAITGTWPNQTFVVTAVGYQVDVTKSPYNAVGDDSTDNTAAIQAAMDANPGADIFIPKANGVGIYRCSGSIFGTTAAGRNFQGNILSDGATIRWTTAGSSADTDAAMSKGFVFYPRTNGAGGDTSGWNGENGKAIMQGLKFIGPTNGAACVFANSINFQVNNCSFSTCRHGAVNESTIQAKYNNIVIALCKNGGISFIASNNANIYYGAAGFPAGMYNDGYKIDGITITGDVVGSAAGILDYGSFSERNRSIKNLSCQGNNLATGLQYGYLGRGVLPTFENIWGENLRTLVRIISNNGNEGGASTLIAGISGAQPSGTMRMDSMPDTNSFGCTIDGAYTHNADIAFQPDCNGPVFVRAILTNATRTCDVRLTQGGKTFYNSGIQTTTSAPPIIQNSYGGYLDMTTLVGLKGSNTVPTIASGFGTSPAIGTYDTTFAFVITVGTGGTADTGVITLPAAPNGWIVTCNNQTVAGTSFTKQTNTTTTSATLSCFATTTGLATPWGAGDLLFCTAIAY
jgi:hypothetical protein